MSAPSLIAQQAAVMDRLSDGMQALRFGHITGGELDSIIAECNDTARAIERESRDRWLLSCATRKAVRGGFASWV